MGQIFFGQLKIHDQPGQASKTEKSLLDTSDVFGKIILVVG